MVISLILSANFKSTFLSFLKTINSQNRDTDTCKSCNDFSNNSLQFFHKNQFILIFNHILINAVNQCS